MGWTSGSGYDGGASCWSWFGSESEPGSWGGPLTGPSGSGCFLFSFGGVRFCRGGVEEAGFDPVS